MKVYWTALAIGDRDRLFDHIEAESPLAAIRIDEAISAQAHQLERFPFSGREGRVAGTRELMVTRTPYILVHVVGTDRIRILRVLHGAQEWPAPD